MEGQQKKVVARDQLRLCELCQLQSATKLVETLSPKGLSDVLLTSKGENKAFRPHPPMQCYEESY